MGSHDLENALSNEPGMLRDFVNGIAGLARESMRPSLVPISGMPGDSQAYYCPGDTELKMLTLPKPPTNHSVDSLVSLADLANARPGCELWYDREYLRLVYPAMSGKPERREGAKMELRLSSQFKLLMDLEGGKKKYTQKELIHLLRVTMNDSLDANGSRLLLAAKSVKFKKQQESESTIEHNRVSIGKSLSAEAAGATDIPEEVCFAVPTWMNKGCEHTAFIHCAVDLDIDEATFRLTPLGGQIERALERAQEALLDELRQNLKVIATCFAGRPY